jgi:hypothetical protein
MKKTDTHHLVYQEIYKSNPVAKRLWGHLTVELPRRYHQTQITSRQRKGYPPAYTAGIIERDRWSGKI